MAAEGRDHLGDAFIGPQGDAVHAVPGGEDGPMLAAQPVPERRMRALQRPQHHRHVLEAVARRAVVDATAGEALIDHVEGVLERLARLREILAIGVELVRRNPLADADVEPASAEMVEHAKLFQQPQRMIER
jgi:hypothetical protein